MPRRMPSRKMDLLLMEGNFKLNLQVIKSFLYIVLTLVPSVYIFKVFIKMESAITDTCSHLKFPL